MPKSLKESKSDQLIQITPDINLWVSRQKELKREPLTRGFLLTSLSSQLFNRLLQRVTKRILEPQAETAVFFIKKIGSDTDFKLVVQPGLGKAEAGSPQWYMTGDSPGSVPNMLTTRQIKNLGINPNLWVHMGTAHSHTIRGGNLFSEHDLDEFDSTINALQATGTLVLPYQAFNLLITISRQRNIEILGIALPPDGLTSTVYQRNQTPNRAAQIAVLRQSGFRVADVQVPWINSNAVLTPRAIETLAALGNQN